MYLKLPFAVKDSPWYPTKRKFTEFEARMDYLMHKGAGEEIPPIILADRWSWSLEDVSDLLQILERTDFLNRDWYIEEESPAKNKAIAQQVVDLFNEIFDRKVQLSPANIRLVTGRIRDGKSMKPKIGIEQFRAVFEFKKKDWKGTAQEKYLRMATLCAPGHFFEYLEEAREDYRKKTAQKKTETEGVKIEGRLFK